MRAISDAWQILVGNSGDIVVATLLVLFVVALGSFNGRSRSTFTVAGSAPLLLDLTIISPDNV